MNSLFAIRAGPLHKISLFLILNFPAIMRTVRYLTYILFYILLFFVSLLESICGFLLLFFCFVIEYDIRMEYSYQLLFAKVLEYTIIYGKWHNLLSLWNIYLNIKLGSILYLEYSKYSKYTITLYFNSFLEYNL